MKKVISIILGILVAASLVVMLVPMNYLGLIPQNSAFTLKGELAKNTYQAGEDIPVTAVFQNNTLHAYMITHGQDMISFSYGKEGEERTESVAPAADSTEYVGPKTTFSAKGTLQIGEPGEYTIYVDAHIGIGKAEYEYSKAYGVVIE